MIIFIILISIILVGVCLILSEFFYWGVDLIYLYDEKGSYRKMGYELEKKSLPKGFKVEKDVLYPASRIKKKVLKKADYFSLEDRGTAGVILILFFGVALLCCGIGSICAHNNLSIANIETTYQTRVDDLNCQKTTILGYKDNQFMINDTDTTSYHIVIMNSTGILSLINKYNSEVIELKKDVYLEKIKLDSPWINWFINPGFMNIEGYNPNATQYKFILGDTLKTFDYNI